MLADTKSSPVIVWTLIWYVSLYFRDWRGALRSVTEIAPKSPFLCVNRSFIRSMIFIQAQKLSGIVWTLPYITTALPSVVHSVQQDLLLEYQVLLPRHLWLLNNERFLHENSAESTKYDRWSTLPHKRAYWAIYFCWTFCLLCPTFGFRPSLFACFVSPYHHCKKTRYNYPACFALLSLKERDILHTLLKFRARWL